MVVQSPGLIPPGEEACVSGVDDEEDQHSLHDLLGHLDVGGGRGEEGL